MVSPVDQRYDVPALAVRTTDPLPQNVVGPLAVMVGVTGIVMGMVRVALALHPPALTTTSRTTDPDTAAANVIAEVFCPEVIVPPLIVHEYVAPLTNGVEALLPVELLQTDAGAVIAAGGSLTATATLFVTVPHEFVTESATVTGPVAPASNVIAAVP